VGLKAFNHLGLDFELTFRSLLQWDTFALYFGDLELLHRYVYRVIKWLQLCWTSFQLVWFGGFAHCVVEVKEASKFIRPRPTRSERPLSRWRPLNILLVATVNSCRSAHWRGGRFSRWASSNQNLLVQDGLPTALVVSLHLLWEKSFCALIHSYICLLCWFGMCLWVLVLSCHPKHQSVEAWSS